MRKIRTIMPVFVSFARFMNRTYSAVIPCICSHLPHHRIESRFDTIPDKSLDCKRFFHFCVIFCAPLHNYPKSTNNTRYKPAILLRGRGRVDWRRATPAYGSFFHACGNRAERREHIARTQAARCGARAVRNGRPGRGRVPPEFSQSGQARRFVILGISSHRAPAAFSRSLPARTRVPARRRPRCPPPSPCECARRDSRCTSRTRASMRKSNAFLIAAPYRCVRVCFFSRSAAVLSAPPCAGAGPLNICPSPPLRERRPA